MNNWFQSKISYTKEDEKGFIKKISETYLVDALSYTEVEKRLYELLTPYIKNFDITTVARAKYTDVFHFEDADIWYRVKMSFELIDINNGSSKMATNTILLTATTVEQALERLNEKMKTMVVDYEITEILKTNILEIFPYDYQLSEAPKGTVSLGISNESVVLEL